MSRAKRHKKSHTGLIVFLLIILLGLGGAYIAYNSLLNYNDVYQADNTDYYAFTVAPGMSGNSIAEKLESEGIISSASRFKLKIRLTDQSASFQAGDFKLSPSMSTDEIIYALQNAKRETVSFTIPEGYTLKDTAEKLAADGLISDVSEFYSALEDEYDYSFIPQTASAEPSGVISSKANRLEGFLSPNTYEVFADANAHEIIDKMLSGFDSIYNDELKSLVANSGYSLQEIITIASLIESESMIDSERTKIASVIYNRLNVGMKLQIDASVLYSLGEHKSRVLYSDLEIDSPYNTYKVQGLPAGPICSPRETSIKAALMPENTNYYYYVLKPDNSGEHNFAENSAQFTKFRQQYLNSL